jgi:hypothetical protein
VRISLPPLVALPTPLMFCSQWAGASFHRRKHIQAVTSPRQQLKWQEEMEVGLVNSQIQTSRSAQEP